MTYWASFVRQLQLDISRSPTRSGSNNRDFFGCSATEIEAIQQAQSVEYLPDLYVEFMLVMGKGFTDWIPFNVTWHYPVVLEFKNRMGVPSINKHHGDNYFVFGEYYHGGGFTFFFVSKQVSNPLVYWWDIEQDVITQAEELSSFLINEFAL